MLRLNILCSAEIGNRSEFSVLLNQLTQRLIRVMIEQARPPFSRGLRQQLLFHLKRFCRIKIVAHDPGERHMSAHLEIK